jgi:hypothetical protein
MASQSPATRHDDIIAAVATLAEQARHSAIAQSAMLVQLVAIEKKLATQQISIATIPEAVAMLKGHHEQIINWKRDGKWLAAAFAGLGAVGAALLGMMSEWAPWIFHAGGK